MPKAKTHKGSSKRFKVTGTGKILTHKANRRHKLEKKAPGRKRKLRKPAELSEGDAKRVAKLLPYS